MNRIACIIILISMFLSNSYSDTEPNDSYEDANIIELDNSVSGSLDEDDTEDWYEVDLPYDGAMEVVVDPETELDTYIWIYDVDGETNLSSADNGSYGEVDSVKISNLMEGIYFIKVQKRYGCMHRNIISQKHRKKISHKSK